MRHQGNDRAPVTDERLNRERRVKARRERDVILLLAVILAACGSAAAADWGGIEMVVTDTYGFKMKLSDVCLMKKGDATAGFKPEILDYFPLGGAAGQTNLWLVQIDKAEFTAAEGGKVDVKAVLQGGGGDEVKGTVENAGQYYLEGQNPDAKVKRARIPLTEAKAVENLTKYETLVDGGRGEITPPMPPPNQDVLWVSSVPLGAQVWVKAFKCEAAKAWPLYKNVGVTPLQCRIPAGQFAVKVCIPPAVVGELKPSTKLGEDTNPFEYDEWGDIDFDATANIAQAMVYTVHKEAGKAATLIALFQKKGAKFADVVAGFPKGHNFHFSDKKLEGELLYREVPKDDIPGILEALHRGGKIIWHGAKRSFLVELKPGARGWYITCPIRPDEKKPKVE